SDFFRYHFCFVPEVRRGWLARFHSHFILHVLHVSGRLVESILRELGQVSFVLFCENQGGDACLWIRGAPGNLQRKNGSWRIECLDVSIIKVCIDFKGLEFVYRRRGVHCDTCQPNLVIPDSLDVFAACLIQTSDPHELKRALLSAHFDLLALHLPLQRQSQTDPCLGLL